MVPGGNALSDAEQDSPASLAVQDTLDSKVVEDTCCHGAKRWRHVTVQDYLWKVVSPQLLDQNECQEILYPVEDNRDLCLIRWWAGKLE
jgi:hypothetical protein